MTGLYSTLYGVKGIYDSLFSRNGSLPIPHSDNIRLNGLSDAILNIPTWLLIVLVIAFVCWLPCKKKTVSRKRKRFK